MSLYLCFLYHNKHPVPPGQQYLPWHPFQDDLFSSAKKTFIFRRDFLITTFHWGALCRQKRYSSVIDSSINNPSSPAFISALVHTCKVKNNCTSLPPVWKLASRSEINEWGHCQWQFILIYEHYIKRGMVTKFHKVLCCMILFSFLALTMHKTQ